MTATLCKQETAASLLCSGLSQRVDEFDQICADMKCTPIEDRQSKWAVFDGQFEELLNKFQSLVRLAQVLCDSSEITLSQLEAIRGNSGAIGAGAVDFMKKQRLEAFEFEAIKAPTLSLPNQTLSENPCHGYPVEKFDIDNLGELSYILPEQHGWLLVFSKRRYETLLSTPRFRFVLEIPGDQIVDYGVYRASELRGQAMSGLEFSHLSEKTKVRIAKAISQAKEGTPAFLEAMENLLYSKHLIPCIFLECLETSARSRQLSDLESTDWDVGGLGTIHPFPSDDSDLTREGSSSTYPPFIMNLNEGGQQLSTLSVEQLPEDISAIPQPPPSSGPLQSIANWDHQRVKETKAPGTIPISLSHEQKHRGCSGSISDQEN